MTRILIVEDHVESRYLLERLLTSGGTRSLLLKTAKRPCGLPRRTRRMSLSPIS